MCLHNNVFLSVASAILSICLIILTLVIIHALMTWRSQKAEKIIKITSLIACIFTIIPNVMLVLLFMSFMGCVSMTIDTIGLMGLYILIIAFVACFYAELGLVCIILWLRLHFTFKESMFAMKRYQRWIVFIGTFVAIFLSAFAALTLSNLIIGILLLLYISLSMYGMKLFVFKMYALTRMRQSSINNQGEFTAQQMKLLYATTKYVTLLSIAMISTLLNALLSWLLVDIFGTVFTAFMMCFDGTINIVCLYLQFSNNKKYYDKYCICFGNCCTYLLMMREAKKLDGDKDRDGEKVEMAALRSIEQNDRNATISVNHP